jgi:cysteine synthase A
MTRPRPPVLTLIGDTPLLPLHFPEANRTLYAKAEFLNPSGSIKDRLALAIIEDAEERGLLSPDSIILECTSGNTGISLAMVGAAKGYRVKILMSESASVERRHLIRQLGGEIQLFAANRGYATGIELSLELAAQDPRIFLPRQFENPLNALDHEVATGPEILAQPAVEGGEGMSWGKALFEQKAHRAIEVDGVLAGTVFSEGVGTTKLKLAHVLHGPQLV